MKLIIANMFYLNEIKEGHYARKIYNTNFFDFYMWNMYYFWGNISRTILFILDCHIDNCNLCDNNFYV